MKYFLILLFLSYSLLIHAQSNIPIENTTSNESPSEEQLYTAEEQIQYSTRLNINKATFIDLFATRLLSKVQVDAILSYRKNNGSFISLYELQAIPSIHTDTLMLLAQQLYVPTLDTYKKSNLLKEGTHYSLLRWERKTQSSKGYQTNSKGLRSYEGEDYRLMYRFRSSITNLYYFGISLEKDAGESFNWQPSSKKYYFDFNSAYLIVFPKKIVDQIAVGDFNYRNGHGLVFGGNFFQSKNPSYWQSTWQIGNGFRPHTSSAEYGYYRGAGMQLKKHHWTFSSLISKSPQDGTIQPDQSISGFNTSGLHRTVSELEKRHNTDFLQAGGSLTFEPIPQNLSMSLEYLHTEFQHTLSPSLNYYNTQSFRGKAHDIIGIDIQKHYASGVLFAEGALSSMQGKSIYLGLLHNLSKQNTWSVQCWSANTSFQSFQGNIPSSASNLSDETGMYQALTLQIARKTTLAIGLSLYMHPHASYLKRGPTYGNEYISRLTYQIKKKTVAFIQFRQLQDEVSSTARKLIPINRYYLMGDLHHHEDIHWEMHSRFQIGIFDFELPEKSYCLTQSISFKHYQFKLNAQLTIFESSSWDSRLYSYEPDVPMTFSIPALSGNGLRTCIVTTLKPIQKTEISLKLSHILYNRTNTIGSGNDEVKGNTQTEVKIQLRVFL